MLHLRKNLKILIILLLINQNILAQLTIDEIIDKHLNTIGLQSDNQKISSFEISGNLAQNKFSLPIKMWGIMPNHLRMNMVFNGVDFIKTSDGKIDWETNPMKDTLIVKKGKAEEAMNFYSRWTGGLTEFKEGKITGELLGLDTIQDVEAYKLKMQKEEKVRIYYIDKLSYLILKVDDEDTEAQKITYYSDYKNVNGFLLAHKLNGFEFGKLVMIMEFDSIKVNIPIDKEMFKMPETR